MNNLSCRVCGEGEEGGNGPNDRLLDNICGCKGSMSAIHASCLEMWLSRCKDHLKCPTCKATFNLDFDVLLEQPQPLRMASVVTVETIFHSTVIITLGVMSALFGMHALRRVITHGLATADNTSRLAFGIAELILVAVTLCSTSYIDACTNIWWTFCTERANPMFPRALGDLSPGEYAWKRTHCAFYVNVCTLPLAYVADAVWCHVTKLATHLYTLNNIELSLSLSNSDVLWAMFYLVVVTGSCISVYHTWKGVLHRVTRNIRRAGHTLISMSIALVVTCAALYAMAPRAHSDWARIYLTVAPSSLTSLYAPDLSNETSATAGDDDEFGLIDYCELLGCVFILVLSVDWYKWLSQVASDEEVEHERQLLFAQSQTQISSGTFWREEADFLWSLSHVPYYVFMALPAVGLVALALTSRKALAFISLVVLWARGSVLTRFLQHIEGLSLAHSSRHVIVRSAPPVS